MIELTGGLVPISKAMDEFETAWKKLVAENDLEDFAETAVAATIGWKVADKHTMFQNLEDLAEQSEQMHIATVEGRFIASILLREAYRGMVLVKILERKAGSVDQLGFDSVDYLVQDSVAAFERLRGVKNCDVLRENNENHAWLSLRFGAKRQYEAKFMDHIVLHVAQKELAAAETAILSEMGVA